MNEKKIANNFKKIDERTFDFALLIIDAYKFLRRNNEYIFSNQILKSGTSIGANVHEAQTAQSKKDFVSKMAVASQEARETEYWLRLLDKSGYLSTFNQKETVFSEALSLRKILTKIVKTSRESISH